MFFLTNRWRTLDIAVLKRSSGTSVAIDDRSDSRWNYNESSIIKCELSTKERLPICA